MPLKTLSFRKWLAKSPFFFKSKIKWTHNGLHRPTLFQVWLGSQKGLPTPGLGLPATLKRIST